MRNNYLKWLGLSVMLSLPLCVMAEPNQQVPMPADVQPLEEVPPPPKLKSDENPDEPQITIIKKNEQTIEEYRINGHLYMMKITPAHGKPYYMHKEDQNGGWLMDGPNPPLVIPKWTILTF